MSSGKPVKDHLGNEYPSMSEMLRNYNINYSAYKYRLEKLKMSQKDALTSPHTDMKSTAITCTDHLGNTFPSKAAMCDYWRLPRTIFFRRIRDGWSLEKALTEPLKYTNNLKKPIYDHLNNEFKTIDEMCHYWNITRQQYMLNIRNNCSLKDALTTITQKGEYKDHLGNVYKSINEMCRQYGITKTVLRSRIELGWTLQQILENPAKKINYEKVKDHLGNEFSSRKEMCQYHNVNEHTFKERMMRGWSVEKALNPKSLGKIESIDHEGNQFGSIFEMCIHWNLSLSTFFGRKNKLKWPLKRILTTITPDRYDKFGPDLTITKMTTDGYYEVCYKNNTYIWSSNQLYDYYRKHVVIQQTGLKSIKSIDDAYYEVETDKGTCVMHYSEITKRLKTIQL